MTTAAKGKGYVLDVSIRHTPTIKLPRRPAWLIGSLTHTTTGLKATYKASKLNNVSKRPN